MQSRRVCLSIVAPSVIAAIMTVRITAWGGYDVGKPRVRLLLDALRRRGVLAGEIHFDVWGAIEDKSVAGWKRLARAAFAWFFGMPRALWRLRKVDRETHVLLPYPGTPEIFFVSLFARRKGGKVLFDAFLPIHDTIVGDRGLLRDGRLLARFLKLFEGIGLRLADVILTDTDQHADFLSKEYGIERDRFLTVLVGAEPQFAPVEEFDSVDDLIGSPDGRPVVLFYGQLIPLHGLATIIEAARLVRGQGIHWIIVGKGQQEPLLRNFLERGGDRDITWISWVDYERLPALIARADLCLGVFGASDKAGRVIPNKLFQVLAMGKPAITRSSAAVDDLARRYPETLVTVPADDPGALSKAAVAMLSSSANRRSLPAEAIRELGPDQGVARLIARLERAER